MFWYLGMLVFMVFPGFDVSCVGVVFDFVCLLKVCCFRASSLYLDFVIYVFVNFFCVRFVVFVYLVSLFVSLVFVVFLVLVYAASVFVCYLDVLMVCIVMWFSCLCFGGWFVIWCLVFRL